MTWFESLANKMGVLEQDENGFYIGKCKVLYDITVDIKLSDDSKILKLSDEEQENLIMQRFYNIFPYLKK